MRLPPLVVALGSAGLVPFLVGPVWMTFWPGSAPYWLDSAWWAYVTLVSAFLCGTFWGFALPAAQGPAGMGAMAIATVLMMFTWFAMLQPFQVSLWIFAVIFLLLLLADFWRERTLDTIPGYFRLRLILTVGAVVAVVWRVLVRTGLNAPA